MRGKERNDSGFTAKWSLLVDEDLEESDKLDEHAEFICSLRGFQRTLLQQFSCGVKLPGAAAKSMAAAALSSGDEPYLGRFTQPYPARPIGASLLDDCNAGAADYACAPLVCVALRGSQQRRAAIHDVLVRLATHPVGLLVTINPEVPSTPQHGGPLLLVLVGLQASTQATSARPNRLCARLSHHSMKHGTEARGNPSLCRSPKNDDLFSAAEQRQMVWAAVHEALWDEEHVMPEVVIEIFMLQDTWLYDRLFRWLSGRSSAGGQGVFNQILTQEELDVIVHQFGEETATHFLFVEQYIQHLRVAAAVAVFCTVVSHLASFGLFGNAAPIVSQVTWLAWGMFLPAWAFHFMASWRAVASRAGFRWLGSLGSVQNSVKEVARLQSAESDVQKRKRFWRVVLLSLPLMLVQLVVVLLVTVTFVVIEVYIYDVVWETMSVTARLLVCVAYNLAFGIAFMLILGVFHPVSKRVTQCEHHPDQDLALWHLTVKVYANWFFAVFLYFFVIAFGYIPFGDRIAEFYASIQAHEAKNPRLKVSSSIRHALLSFHPDVHRLAVDVCLFFVLQDLVRLMQVLVPVLLAWWNLGQLKGRIEHRQPKRTAVFSSLWAMCKAGCITRFAISGTNEVDRCREMEALHADNNFKASISLNQSRPRAYTDRSSVVSRMSTASLMRPRLSSAGVLLPCRIPNTPATRNPSKNQGKNGSLIAYVCIEGVELASAGEDEFCPTSDPKREVVVFACSPEHAPAASSTSPAVTSRLRTCALNKSKQSISENDPLSGPMDLLTVTCDPELLAQGSPAHVRLRLVAEVLQQEHAAGGHGSKEMHAPPQTTWGVVLEFHLEGGPGEGGLRSGSCAGRRGLVHLGPVQARYTAGLVWAQTHYEALELVPLALSQAQLRLTPGGSIGREADQESASSEEVEVSALAGPHWLWWDEELSNLYWEEVFELFAVNNTFETFEIYAHLTTSFSYVCLFGVSVPLCPLLALFFTIAELRQDQLRLLWLSRPPHPDQKTLRFKWRVSLGAWYDIIHFTCHLSVVVNILLLGLTYNALTTSRAADWSISDWWRALASFLLFERGAVVLGGLLHSYISQLDHETARAYLRRYTRLRRLFLSGDDSSDDEFCDTRSPQSIEHKKSRRRLTRIHSGGLSSLV